MDDWIVVVWVSTGLIVMHLPAILFGIQSIIETIKKAVKKK